MNQCWTIHVSILAPQDHFSFFLVAVSLRSPLSRLADQTLSANDPNNDKKPKLYKDKSEINLREIGFVSREVLPGSPVHAADDFPAHQYPSWSFCRQPIALAEIAVAAQFVHKVSVRLAGANKGVG